MSPACSRKTFYVRFRSCHQRIIDVSSCFLLDMPSKWFDAVEKATVVSWLFRLHGTRENCRTVRVVSHALGAPLTSGNAHTASLPMCCPVPALPLEAVRSKLCFLFRLGSKAPGERLRCSPPMATTRPFRAALSFLWCIIAGVAEKKSSFPFRVVVHPTSCQGSGSRVGAWHDFDDCVLDFCDFHKVFSTCLSNCI